MSASTIRAADVLEFLDHVGGRASVGQLRRRGIDEHLVAELVADKLVVRGEDAVTLTDRGAASIADPPPTLREQAGIRSQRERPRGLAPPENPERNGRGHTVDRILALLAAHPEGIRAMEVHRQLGLSQGSCAGALSSLYKQGRIDKRKIGTGGNQGVLYFPVGGAPSEETPTKVATREPGAPAAEPPSDPGDLERYLGLLGRMAMIEAPDAEVLDRLEGAG